MQRHTMICGLTLMLFAWMCGCGAVEDVEYQPASNDDVGVHDDINGNNHPARGNDDGAADDITPTGPGSRCDDLLTYVAECGEPATTWPHDRCVELVAAVSPALESAYVDCMLARYCDEVISFPLLRCEALLQDFGRGCQETCDGLGGDFCPGGLNRSESVGTCHENCSLLEGDEWPGEAIPFFAQCAWLNCGYDNGFDACLTAPTIGPERYALCSTLMQNPCDEWMELYIPCIQAASQQDDETFFAAERCMDADTQCVDWRTCLNEYWDLW